MVDYTEELGEFRERLEEELDASYGSDGSVMAEIATDRIAAGSLLDDDHIDAYEEGAGTFHILKQSVMKRYRPGVPLDVPVDDGQPYGLGLDIETPVGFGAEDFDEMVDELYDDAKGYSWREVKERYEEWEDEPLSLGDAARVGTELAGLVAMKAIKPVLYPGLTRSVATDGNSFGIRLYETDDANYLVLNAGMTSHERTLDEAEEVMAYLDEWEGLN